MEINYISIGMRIRKFRKKMKITQAELGEKALVEPTNISHIERGATKVSLPTLLKIANSLSVSLDDLVYDSLNNNAHISIKEINEVISDCTDKELKAIAQIIQPVKNALRN